MKTLDRKITVQVKGRDFVGAYSTKDGMIKVTSEHGSKSVHGTTQARAEETLRELVRESPDLVWD